MQKAIMITILCLCFCHGSAFAERTVTNTAMLDDSAASGAIGTIIGTIEKLDTWIQKNLW